MAHGELVFSVSYIGDLVTAAGALPLLDAAHGLPALVVAPAAAPLVSADARLSAVHVVSSSTPLGWRAQVLKLLIGARGRRSCVLNLEVYAPRWRFLARSCRVLGLPARHLDLAGMLADNRRSALGEPTCLAHRSDYYSMAVGAELPAPWPRLTIDAARAEQARGRLLLDSGAQFVLVHPGSSDPARRAPLDLLARVVSGLAAVGCRAVVTGTRAESDLAHGLQERLAPGARAISACGRLDLRELAALTSQADLFIGGDSGPLKIAEAVGARTLSFWHRGQPSAAFAGPRGPGHATLPATASAAEALAAASQLLAR